MPAKGAAQTTRVFSRISKAASPPDRKRAAFAQRADRADCARRRRDSRVGGMAIAAAFRRFCRSRGRGVGARRRRGAREPRSAGERGADRTGIGAAACDDRQRRERRKRSETGRCGIGRRREPPVARACERRVGRVDGRRGSGRDSRRGGRGGGEAGEERGEARRREAGQAGRGAREGRGRGRASATKRLRLRTPRRRRSRAARPPRRRTERTIRTPICSPRSSRARSRPMRRSPPMRRSRARARRRRRRLRRQPPRPIPRLPRA